MKVVLEKLLALIESVEDYSPPDDARVWLKRELMEVLDRAAQILRALAAEGTKETP